MHDKFLVLAIIHHHLEFFKIMHNSPEAPTSQTVTSDVFDFELTCISYHFYWTYFCVKYVCETKSTKWCKWKWNSIKYCQIQMKKKQKQNTFLSRFCRKGGGFPRMMGVSTEIWVGLKSWGNFFFFESHAAVAAADTQKYLNERAFSHWQTLGCPCFPTGTVSGILGGGCPG